MIVRLTLVVLMYYLLDFLSMTVKEWKKEQIEEFFNRCLQRFGSMNKNDYEVALFHLLLMNDFTEMTDYEISTKLRIPESKVKRLRYEESLVYPITDEELNEKLLTRIRKGSFKMLTDCIQFAINDKKLRLYLNNKLEKGNHFADSSFNSNIVSITANDLEFLLDGLKISKDDRETIIEIIKQKINDNQKGLPLNTKEKILKFGGIVMRIIGGSVLEKLVNDSINEIEKQITNK